MMTVLVLVAVWLSGPVSLTVHSRVFQFSKRAASEAACDRLSLNSILNIDAARN